MKKLALALALAMPLTGCAALPGLLGSAGSAQQQAVLRGSQALLVAENAYQAAEAVVAPLIRAHVLSAPIVDRISQINDEADKVVTTSNLLVSDAEKAQQITSLAAELRDLVPLPAHGTKKYNN